MPELSVVIPAYNAEKFLREAVESVLAQTASVSTEILVYNDGSTDATSEVVAALGAKVVAMGDEGPSRGAANARNQCMERAQGAYLAFLDADDLWLPDKIAKQLAVVSQASQPTLAFGEVQEFDHNGPRGEYAPAALTSCCLLHTELARSVAPLSESLTLGDFAEWLSRLQASGAMFDYSAGPVTRRRIHADNMGRRMVDRRQDYLEVIRRKLARERASDPA